MYLNAEPQPGDLYMFQLETFMQIGYHTGVYCGQGEIIHFMGEQKQIWPVTDMHWGENWDESVGL